MSLTIGGLKRPILVVEDTEYQELIKAILQLEEVVESIEDSLGEYLTGHVDWSIIKNVEDASDSTPGIAKLGDSGVSRDEVATLSYVKSKSGSSGVPTSRKVNGHPLTSDVVLTSQDVNSMSRQEVTDYLDNEASKHSLVPTTRKVMGEALSNDVTITPDMFGEPVTSEDKKDLTWVKKGTRMEPLRAKEFSLYGKKFVNGALVYTHEDIGVPSPEEFYNDEQSVIEYGQKVAHTKNSIGMYLKGMFVGSSSVQSPQYNTVIETNQTLAANYFNSGLSYEGGGTEYGKITPYFVDARLGPEIFIPESEPILKYNANDYVRMITRLDPQGNRYYRKVEFCKDINGELTWE